MDQVHFAFRLDGSALVNRHSTYEIRAEAGRVRLTPRRPPDDDVAEDVRSSPSRARLAKSKTLELETREVSRDGRSLLSHDARQHVGDKGELVVERGNVIETWTNGDEGSEQAWKLQTRPEGSGELVIEVAVHGLDYAGSTEGAFHFGHESGEGVRYGKATWVDARERRVEVPGSLEDDRIVLRVPPSVVDGAAYPVVIDPVVGPEFGMQSVLTPGPTPNARRLPAVAFDGTTYLVVWADLRERDYYYGSSNGSTSDNYDIFAARVSATGTVLDPLGIPLRMGQYSQDSPAVAFDGANYFVVWQDFRSGTSYDLYGTRVSTAGVVLDPDGIAVSVASGSQTLPALGFDGTNYMVVWQDARTGVYVNDIYGARVNPAGQVLDPSGIAVSTALFTQTAPALAFDGTNYLVAWEDYRNSAQSDIYATRLSTGGAVQDPTGIPVSTGSGNERAPALAFDGTNHFVVWQDDRAGTYDIYGARVNTAGTPLDAGIVLCAAVYEQHAPAVAFDGTNYLVVWGDNRNGTSGFPLMHDIYGTRVSAGGQVLDPAGIVVRAAAGVQDTPALVFDGTNYLTAYIDSGDISATRMRPDGSLLDSTGIHVTTAEHQQYAPDVAFDGTNYLVVWQQNTTAGTYDTFDIYAARVSATGTVLDPSGIAVSAMPHNETNPVVAFDGANYFVVWEEEYSSNIYGARVSKAGAVLDAPRIALTSSIGNQSQPSIDFDGVNYLVVWRNVTGYAPLPGGSGGYTLYGIYGTRVSTAGSVLDGSPIVVSSDTALRSSPAVAFDGTNHLVVWQDRRTGVDFDIYGARVSTAGQVLDASGLGVSSATGDQLRPALDYDGANFLVVWGDRRNGLDLDIYGTRVNPDGTVSTPQGFAISTATSNQEGPTVAFASPRQLVLWQDGRNGRNDIYGARVSTADTVLDPSGFTVSVERNGARGSPQRLPRINPRLASDGTCNAIAVYDPVTPEAGYVHRVAATILGCDPTTRATCDAGACSDAGVTDGGGTDAGPAANTGGTVSTGGATSTGGTTSTGGGTVMDGGGTTGAATNTGGTMSTGGTTGGTGGSAVMDAGGTADATTNAGGTTAINTGGTMSTGGAAGNADAATGGALGSGGAGALTGSGGITASDGSMLATGGTTSADASVGGTGTAAAGGRSTAGATAYAGAAGAATGGTIGSSGAAGAATGSRGTNLPDGSAVAGQQDEGGCGCRAAGRSSEPPGLDVVALILASVALTGRKRRKRGVSDAKVTV